MISDDSNNLAAKSGIQFADWADAFGSLDVAISIISPDLKLEYVNDSYRDIVKIPPEIGPGSNARDLYLYLAERGDFGAGDPQAQAGEKLDALANDTWQDAVQEMVNGRVIKIKRTVTEDGYILTTITDITSVKKNENLIKTVLDATDQAIIIINASGYVELVNKAYTKLFGSDISFSPQARTFQSLMVDAWREGKFSGDFFGDEVNSITEEQFEACTLEFGELALSQPLTIMLSSGTYVRFASRFIDKNFRIFTFTDITDGIERQKDISRAKKLSETALEDFTFAMDNMDVGYLLLDENLNTLIINKAYHQIWDSTPQSVPVGCNFRHILELSRENQNVDIDDREWDKYAEFCLEELRVGNIKSRDVQLANGKQLVFSCVNLTDGKRLVSFSDVTEFKQREQALKQAQLRAESADRSKSEFLANMSHEIRTPMNGVMGMAELLSNTDLDSKQKTFTEIILSSSNALLTIINDILDFSKIEAGKLELDPAPFMLRESIEDVVALMASSIIEKDLEIIVRVQPDLVNHVVGDVGRFRQVLTNLLGNAVKFTETGHVLVNVSGCLSDKGVELECFVQDTGIGIPQNQIDSVFEKFSQVDGSSTRRHEGTGLGLAIASRLVNLMGGRIGCNSRLGEGSTFWFTAILEQDLNAKPAMEFAYDITGKRILAIDDNSVNRSILLEQFSAWKLDGEAAASGLEGLAMLRQAIREEKPYGAIVLDYHMPDLNGLEVARVIRSDEILKDTAIIMLTSVDNIKETETFRDLNIEAHLTKPARASQLLESIIDVMSTNDGNINSQKSMPGFPGTQEIEAGKPAATPPLAQPEQSADEHVDSSIAKIRQAQSEEIYVADNNPQITAPADTMQTPDSLPANEGVRILVVEDNEVNQIVFTQILQHLNYSYELVSNGKLAVEAVEKLRPQVVLMDVSMPVMNGLDATKEIRSMFSGDASSSNYRPIIIGITAHALKEDRNLCLSAGMDDYLSKPISPDLLVEKIKQWLPEDKFDFLAQFSK